MSDNAGVIALPPMIYGTALVIGLVVHCIVPIPLLPPTPAIGLGILSMLVSSLIVVSAFRALTRAKTTFDTRQPATAVVGNGAFRYSRNPMYVSMALLYIEIAFFVNSLWLLLLVVPLMVVIQRGVVEREEQYLERKFGEEYRRYKAPVRRWISSPHQASLRHR
ncbi:MAG: isoprenylcysteine carboxylmethyltransferase family protein [Candidatus Tectomicrobia bacterium]